MRLEKGMIKQNKLYYGADYTPEQWSEEVLVDDIQRMKQAHVNYVSINIFTWALLQDDTEAFHFEQLDRVVELLTQNEIGIDMGTGTASPPAWLIRKHPEILPVDFNGTVLKGGSRQHYCPSNEVFRRYTAQLAEEVGKRYGQHPGVVMWHINNEYTCHIDGCYCDRCKEAFQQWLQDKYGTLDALNECWHTRFWSQYYYQWQEIDVPSKTPTFINPTQQLDFKRFVSQQNHSLYMLEKEALRRHSNYPIMTNFMGLHKAVDGFAWAKDLDVITWNSYPNPFEAVPHAQFMANDLMRSLKNQPFLIMESATSAVNWRAINAAKQPGKMRLWSMESVAHGADGIMFFQWRASKGGAEKFHSAMVPHSQDRQSKIVREVDQLGAELTQLSEIVGSTFCSEVTILFDWENWWALEGGAKPRELKKIHELLVFYKALRSLNIPVSFAHPESDFSASKLVIAPTHYLLTEKACASITAYVAQGGTLITTYFSGIVDENDSVYLGGYPGLLKETLGVYVEEFFPTKNAHSIQLEGQLVANSTWEELIHPLGQQSTVLGTFTSEGLEGKPAIVKNACGSGTTYYFGTKLDEAAMVALLGDIVAECELQRSPFNAALHWTCRESEEYRYHFLLNYSGASQQVSTQGYWDLLRQQPSADQMTLLPNDVVILREEKAGN